MSIRSVGLGPVGASAYDVARRNGFKGTMQDWLASLKGADGKTIASGNGPPTISGKTGDLYVDLTSGDLYRMEA